MQYMLRFLKKTEKKAPVE